jgi:hypothetical protein
VPADCTCNFPSTIEAALVCCYCKQLGRASVTSARMYKPHGYQKLTSGRAHAGHLRKVALHGRNICESLLSKCNSSPVGQPLGSDIAPPPLPEALEPGWQTGAWSPQLASANRPAPPRQQLPSAGSSAELQASATLIPYCHLLTGVRLSDELTSKTALSLLFQLVQWQMRKAERFKGVRAVPCGSCAVHARFTSDLCAPVFY